MKQPISAALSNNAGDVQFRFYKVATDGRKQKYELPSGSSLFKHRSARHFTTFSFSFERMTHGSVISQHFTNNGYVWLR